MNLGTTKNVKKKWGHWNVAIKLDLSESIILVFILDKQQGSLE